jgi:CheY-like chemotaxis protein
MNTLGFIPRSKKNTILIVEDDADIGVFLQMVLTEETIYLVQHVLTGQQALDAVLHTNPLLFLLDYQLPIMSGVLLYDILHRMPQFTHVPALVMSANLPMAELNKRHLIGISKPFDLDVLIATVKRLLDQ